MQNIIDIHTHILWDVDDGPKTFSGAVDMLRLAARNGTQHMIATPHFRRAIVTTREEILLRVQALNDYAQENQLPIKVYPGNEIYVNTENLNALYAGKALTLADSAFVLLEFSSAVSPLAVEEITQNVFAKGFIPVIAHAERSITFQNKFEFLKKLCQNNVRLQIDAASLFYRNGYSLARYTRKLIKAGLAFAVASDCHNLRSRSPRLAPTFRLLSRLVGHARAQALLYDNPLEILKNEL